MSHSTDSGRNGENKTLLLTGGTGFIGRFLVPRLVADGWDVVVYSRQHPEKVTRILGADVRSIQSLGDWSGSEPPAVCINLAGEGIMDRRWTAARKQILRDSRIGLTMELAGWLKRWQRPLDVLISGSATGFYGVHDGDLSLDESAPAGTDFAAMLCDDWEQSASAVPAERRCILRTGIVLHSRFGALSKLLLPFKMGVGGPVGCGEQVMSWIHIDDMVSGILHLLGDEQASGAFNMVAPNAVTNREFSRALGQALHRPSFMPMPAPVLKLMLGEGALLLLEGQRPVPAALKASGFSFSFPALEQALVDLL